MRPLLLIPFPAAPWLGDALDGMDVEPCGYRRLPRAAELDATRPTVIVLDAATAGVAGLPALEALAGVAALLWTGQPPAGAVAGLLSGAIGDDAPADASRVQLGAALRHGAALALASAAAAREAQLRQDLAELAEVGVALSTERDLRALLELILAQARRLTLSDAGSIYLLEGGTNGQAAPVLRFMLAQNSTLPDLALGAFTVPVDHSSLAGHAAAAGEPLVIDDVARLPESVPYRQNRTFDERLHYWTKSVLVIPMKTHRGEVIGVLQLLNRKRTLRATLHSARDAEREVVPYDERSVAVVSALAAQAAVAIENSTLYESIERLFEGFVAAAAAAIEARDPATRGHSARVAQLAVRTAESLERAADGPYAGTRFSREQLRELRYAALLHDFGKVAVREQLLVKEKKLHPAALERVRSRFAYLHQAAELTFERARADFLLACGRARYAEAAGELERQRQRRHAELDGYLAAVLAANEPSRVTETSFEELQGIAAVTYLGPDGAEQPLITGEELRALSVRRGNLDECERREVESHVMHTHRFLEQIPWTAELRGVPAIALGHHEKLDGTGYPRGVRAADIPLLTRIITVADIFDALTATDRPYKAAMPSEYALAVLRSEAEAGMLDLDLVELFAAAQPWTRRSGEVRAVPSEPRQLSTAR